MPSLSVPTEGAFGSSSVLVPRELAIHGKKRKKKKEKKQRKRKKRLCPGVSRGGEDGMGAAGIA